MMDGCLFCRIASGAIPARIAYEDDEILAFYDIDPRAPVHVLLIPRVHIASVNEIQSDHAPTVGRLYIAAAQIARELGVADSGYRLVMNNGADAGQTVDHIHLHLLGGRSLKWPPG
jgi:histidine triad (HIT) family protein